ncbi:Phage minor capsid protein 2 [Nonomuraea maritima]|uniref:Phage minor capsid protein 2 n=1 Tax=Nonomuraea maritima TaxID=683260 RepID=A0A1G9MGP0_9ACTN|nr:phage minor capsid protein [Nonomuraea maritima]SDL73436.1 Phage minor capsid protein 2 [Nonomuraea maritima]
MSTAAAEALAQQELQQFENSLDHARAVAAVYYDAERELLRIVSESLAARLGEPEWEGVRFAEIRELRRQADRVVARLERLSDKLVTTGVNTAWRRGVKRAMTDLSHLGNAKGIGQGQGVIELARQTVQRVHSVHIGALRTTEDVYSQVIAQVAGRALAGAETREQATKRALDMFARKGIAGFTDSSGRSWSMGSYTEMAVRTAMSRAAVDGHLSTLQENGVDLVIVSRLPFTCERCDFWEGKILTQAGSIGWRQELSYVSDEMVDVLVEGTVEQARTAGLMHPGCGHNLRAYLPGATKRPPVQRHPAGYRDMQKMRRTERDLRAARRQASVALDKTDRDRAEVRANRLTNQIHELAEDKRLPVRTDRQKAKVLPRSLETRSDEELAALLGQHADDEPAVKRITQVLEERDQERERDRDEQVTSALRELPEDYSQVTEEQILELVQRFSAAGDDVALERLLAELDRREQNPNWRYDVEETAEDRAVAELLDSGTDPLEAYAIVYGLDPEVMRREEARAHVESQRLPGETLDQVVRRLYDEWLEIHYVAAERYTRGVLVTAEGRRQGVDGRSLLSGPAARAMKWASDELKAWWEQHPRMTLTEFRAQALGRDSDKRAARRTREDRR